MVLPHRESAYIPPAKLTGYLLSETHPVGRFKARLFYAAGYDPTNAQSLERALIDIAHEQEVTDTISTSYGTIYVIDGTLQTPMGIDLQIRTVWIIVSGESSPRLVTAYPD
jgi:hypothetical protein